MTRVGEKWILSRAKALLNNNGQPIRMAGSLTDIDERKHQQAVVEYMAFHDNLTGLPNRAFVSRRLAELLAGGPESHTGAILLFDLDNFKIVNDTFGHSYGDKLLIKITEILKNYTGNMHFTARMGGDEFVIILEGQDSRSEVLRWVDSLHELFARPIAIEDKILHTTISIGITLFPQDGRDFKQLIKNADLALYKAKERGKNQYAFFDNSLALAVQGKAAMEQDIRQALVNNEFQLWYQPQIDVLTGEIVGLEALLRWSSPTGMVMPMQFIPLAEESGLIIPLGYWVIKEAGRFISELTAEGFEDLAVTVNISVVQLLQSNFAEEIRNIMRVSGISPKQLGIEITESVLMESMETNIRKLRLLRKTGLAIYLDDFGTGYSSLKYLKHLPIDVVKIDRSFTSAIENEEDKDLMESIISLIHKLGLKAVAEGVESEAQFIKLKEYGCDLVQGYLFSRPIPAGQVRELLQRYRDKG